MAIQSVIPRPATVVAWSAKLGIAALPASSIKRSTRWQFFPCALSYVVVSSPMSEPHIKRINGESASKSCSFQRRYTVIGFSENMSSAGVKSDPARERMTVSVKSGLIRAVRVTQAESKNRSVKLAVLKGTSRNFVLSSSLLGLIYSPNPDKPLRFIFLTYGKGGAPL